MNEWHPYKLRLWYKVIAEIIKPFVALEKTRHYRTAFLTSNLTHAVPVFQMCVCARTSERVFVCVCVCVCLLAHALLYVLAYEGVFVLTVLFDDRNYWQTFLLASLLVWIVFMVPVMQQTLLCADNGVLLEDDKPVLPGLPIRAATLPALTRLVVNVFSKYLPIHFMYSSLLPNRRDSVVRRMNRLWAGQLRNLG